MQRAEVILLEVAARVKIRRQEERHIQGVDSINLVSLDHGIQEGQNQEWKLEI